MIAKLIVWGEDRNSALQNTEHALNNFHVVGPETNIEFLLRAITHEHFITGEVNTSFILENQKALLVTKKPSAELLAFGILGSILNKRQKSLDGLWFKFSGFLINSPMILTSAVTFENKTIRAKLIFQKNNLYQIEFIDPKLPPVALNGMFTNEKFNGTANGKKVCCSVVQNENKLFIFSKNERCTLKIPFIELGNVEDLTVGAKSPMPGRVVKVFVKEGQKVKKGELICLMEAMKMRHEIRSIKKGTIETILYQPGDFVESDQPLVEIKDVA